MAGEDGTGVKDQVTALPGSLFHNDPGAVLPDIVNGFSSPMFLSQPVAIPLAAAPAGPTPTPTLTPTPLSSDPTAPPTPPSTTPPIDPRKIHSQPGTVADSVQALTDLCLYNTPPAAPPSVTSSSACDCDAPPTLTQQQLQAATALTQQLQAAAAAAVAAAPPSTPGPGQDPRLAAAAAEATLTQQLQAANALNQQLQATAITQQMQMDTLNRQLNQQLQASTSSGLSAPPAVAPQYPPQFHQYPPAAFASAPTAAQQQQQQLQALSHQLQINALLQQQHQQAQHQQAQHQQQQQQAAAAVAAAQQQQQTLTSSPQLTSPLTGVPLISTTTASQQQAAAGAALAMGASQPQAAVVATGAGGQQVLLTPAGMATALGSAAATAPAALQLLQQTTPPTQALLGAAAQQQQQQQQQLGAGSLSTSATSTATASERSAKIKLLLSSGGQFEKCMVSGTWEYHGGETRLVTVAHTPAFQQLLVELSKGTTTMLHDERVQLKYELPGSPDVLVDLINDDDVDNMWDEWQSFTLTAKPTYKLHVFVQLLLDTPSASSASTTTQRASGGSSQSAHSSGTPTAAAPGTPPAGGGVEAVSNGTITTQPRVDLLDLEGKLELIPPCDLTIVKFLGSGGYGEVYLSRWHSSDVAVKCLNPSLFSANEGLGSVSEEVVGELVKEANLLGSLRHPNVVWVYGLVLPTGSAMQRLKGQLEPGQSIDAVGFAATAANQAGLAPGVVRPPALVTEYLAGGSLRNAITRKEEWLQSRSVQIKLMLDTARGMEYLHAKRIVHFDLKSGNLLIGFQNRAPVCKVADFGLSKQRQQTYVTGVTSMRGTLPWTAPEIIRSPKAVDEKVDVYSFGICMWEIWTGREPFEGINYHALLHMMTQQNGLRPPLPGSPEWELGELEEPAEGWIGLMTRCWSDAAAARPAFVEIVRELQAMLAAARASRRAASA